MKKLLAITMVGLLILSVMTGCGSKPSENSNDSNSNKAEPIKYTVASSMAPGDAIPLALDLLVEEALKNSNGVLVGETFHNAQLGSQRDYIDSMQMGSIQIAESATPLLAGIVPMFSIFDMPYISRDMDHTLKVLEDGLAEKLSSTLEKEANLKVIGWALRTPRNVYSSKGPINTVDDFKNLKIRTMETAPVMKAMELLGAKPVPIPGTERYMALQTKVVDAAENSSAEILMKKEYEVTKYISKTEHLIVPNPICVDAKFFNSLSPDLQQVLMDAGKKAGEYATELEIKNLKKVEEELKKQGMIINEISDKTPFIEKVKPVYDEYVKDFGQDVLDAFLK